MRPLPRHQPSSRCIFKPLILGLFLTSWRRSREFEFNSSNFYAQLKNMKAKGKRCFKVWKKYSFLKLLIQICGTSDTHAHEPNSRYICHICDMRQLIHYTTHSTNSTAKLSYTYLYFDRGFTRKNPLPQPGFEPRTFWLESSYQGITLLQGCSSLQWIAFHQLIVTNLRGVLPTVTKPIQAVPERFCSNLFLHHLCGCGIRRCLWNNPARLMELSSNLHP